MESHGEEEEEGGDTSQKAETDPRGKGRGLSEKLRTEQPPDSTRSLDTEPQNLWLTDGNTAYQWDRGTT